MNQELTSLWNSLGDAEYLHLLLEPMPLCGLLFGFLFYIGSLFLGHAKSRMLALFLMAAACSTVQPYVALRAKSEPRILALQDPAYHALTKEQSARRSSSTWLYYGIAAVCLIALVLGRGGKGLFLNATTLLICAIGLIHATWLHKKECEVYHRNVVKFVPVK